MFRKFFCFILFILCFTACAAFAEGDVSLQLNRIENEMWGFSYDSESDIQRVERIENQIFGVPSKNSDIAKRVDKITKSLGLESLEEAKSSLNDLYVAEKEGPGVEYPQIDRLEGALLGSVYKNENIYVRLERLEKKVFGTKQEGDLAARTEALKRHSQVGTIDSLASNSRDGYQTRSQFDRNYQMNPYQYQENNSDIKFQIAAVENMIFSTDFSNEPVPLRLNRLENSIFQRNFADDDDATRISRIQAAASAKRTAKYYDNNKFQKFAATGLQAASFLLMILAFIL